MRRHIAAAALLLMLLSGCARDGSMCGPLIWLVPPLAPMCLP